MSPDGTLTIKVKIELSERTVQLGKMEENQGFEKCPMCSRVVQKPVRLHRHVKVRPSHLTPILIHEQPPTNSSNWRGNSQLLSLFLGNKIFVYRERMLMKKTIRPQMLVLVELLFGFGLALVSS